MLVKQTEINFKDYTISRQVIDGVVSNLLKLTRVEDPDIIYSTVLSNSNLIQSNAPIGEGRKADFGVSDNQVLLQVTEVRSEENRIMRGLGLTDVELPLFKDSHYGVGMFTNSVEYEVEIEMQLRHGSRSRAEAWASDKMSRIESGLETFITEGDFHYHVPQTCLKLAEDVLAAAKVNDPTEVRTLEEYFEANLGSAVTVVTDQAGQSRSLVATQRVSRVEVIFDSAGVQKEKDEKGEELGGYVSTISCKFNYVRPETIMLRYPAMYNGTVIDDFWWYDGTVPGLSDTENAIATPFIAAGEQIVNQKPLLSLPRFLQDIDYEIPEFVKRDEHEIGLAISYIDYVEPEGEATPLFNLKELGDLELSDNTLDYIRTAITYDIYLRYSVIKIYILINGKQAPSDIIAISPDLTVWLNAPMVINKTYQLVITINPNLTGISDNMFDIIRLNPGFTRDYLADLHPDVLKEHQDAFDEETIPADDLGKIVVDATEDPILKKYKHTSLKSSYMVNILNGRILSH